MMLLTYSLQIIHLPTAKFLQVYSIQYTQDIKGKGQYQKVKVKLRSSHDVAHLQTQLIYKLPIPHCFLEINLTIFFCHSQRVKPNNQLADIGENITHRPCKGCGEKSENKSCMIAFNHLPCIYSETGLQISWVLSYGHHKVSVYSFCLHKQGNSLQKKVVQTFAFAHYITGVSKLQICNFREHTLKTKCTKIVIKIR